MPVGRPSAAETQARTREFVRLLLDGCAFDVAAARARVKPERALRILADLEGVRVVTVDREQAA